MIEIKKSSVSAQLRLRRHISDEEDIFLSKTQNKKTPPKGSKTFRALAHFSQIGVTMAASVLIGVLIGKHLDILFGTSPWLLLIFSLLGVGAAIRALFHVPDDKEK
jgi:ATP synthase protein I